MKLRSSFFTTDLPSTRNIPFTNGFDETIESIATFDGEGKFVSAKLLFENGYIVMLDSINADELIDEDMPDWAYIGDDIAMRITNYNGFYRDLPPGIKVDFDSLTPATLRGALTAISEAEPIPTEPTAEAREKYETLIKNDMYYHDVKLPVLLEPVSHSSPTNMAALLINPQEGAGWVLSHYPAISAIRYPHNAPGCNDADATFSQMICCNDTELVLILDSFNTELRDITPEPLCTPEPLI